MPESLSVVRDEEAYWALARGFVRALIVEVNGALRKAGVEEKARRRKICERAVFGIGNLIDQYWLEVDGRTVYPVLCFSDRFPAGETPLRKLGPVQFPEKAVELHAMASDEVEWFFKEQKEKDSAVTMGCVGEEEDAQPGAEADGGA